MHGSNCGVCWDFWIGKTANDKNVDFSSKKILFRYNFTSRQRKRHIYMTTEITEANYRYRYLKIAYSFEFYFYCTGNNISLHCLIKPRAWSEKCIYYKDIAHPDLLGRGQNDWHHPLETLDVCRFP